jgi:hypothetical protein
VTGLKLLPLLLDGCTEVGCNQAWASGLLLLVLLLLSVGTWLQGALLLPAPLQNLLPMLLLLKALELLAGAWSSRAERFTGAGPP